MRKSTTLEFTPETQPHWAWSPDAIRHVGHLVVELIAQHLTSRPERPVFTPFPVELAERLLSADVPRAGQAFLSSTTLDGTFALRACIINPRTTAEDLAYLVALVQDLGRQLTGGGA